MDLSSKVLILLKVALISSCIGDQKDPGKMVRQNDSTELASSMSKQPMKQQQPDVQLYYFYDLEEYRGVKSVFVSLSDNYIPSSHKDSLAMPDISSIPVSERNFIVLQNPYRSTFLHKTGISENDSVFVIDFSSGAMRTFAVRDLRVAANMNAYSEGVEVPTQFDYEIGFELPKEQVLDVKDHHNFVAVGKENPFAVAALKLMNWKNIPRNKFPPSAKKAVKLVENSMIDSTFLAVDGSYQYFLRDYYDSTERNNVTHRHLVVVDTDQKKIIKERLFIQDEGSSMSPLNLRIVGDVIKFENQWAGKLFKNSPEVVFGFESISFGCPIVTFLDSDRKDLSINCDNRH